MRLSAPATLASVAVVAALALALPGLVVPASSPSIRVIDGDTLQIGSERVRIANIDAPELFSPECPAERERGLRAAARLVELVGAGPVTLRRQGVDRYGRTLATLRADGRDLGELLVEEGMAQPWRGRKAHWC